MQVTETRLHKNVRMRALIYNDFGKGYRMKNTCVKLKTLETTIFVTAMKPFKIIAWFVDDLRISLFL